MPRSAVVHADQLVSFFVADDAFVFAVPKNFALRAIGDVAEMSDG